MKTIFATVAAAPFVLGVFLIVTPAQARPPTVLYSPGYQARLVESRKEYSNAWYAHYGQPPAPQAASPAPKRTKRHPPPQ